VLVSIQQPAIAVSDGAYDDGRWWWWWWWWRWFWWWLFDCM